MLTCWQCGRRLPEGRSERRNVVAHYGAGYGGRPLFGAATARVDLCRPCAARADARRRRAVRTFVFLAALALLLVGMLYAYHRWRGLL